MGILSAQHPTRSHRDACPAGNVYVPLNRFVVHSTNSKRYKILGFTGYCFSDRSEIQPFLEDPRTGPTISWAKRQAIRLGKFKFTVYGHFSYDSQE